MSKAKELFNETTISNIHKATILFKDETDIIKTELEYADKCRKLEEELGCQLEVIKKLRKTNYIYRDDGVGFGFIGINFNDEDKLILYNDDECNTFTSDLRLVDYKKTWWLREDKSE